MSSARPDPGGGASNRLEATRAARTPELDVMPIQATTYMVSFGRTVYNRNGALVVATANPGKVQAGW